MKKGVLILLTAVTLAMTGCASGKETLEKCIRQLSGIENDADYLQAVNLQENGLLNEAGEYEESEYNDLKKEYQKDLSAEAKQVHVTIADNPFLEIEYYLDSVRTRKVEEASLDMDPGDKLYCSQPESRNSNNAYLFSEFRIYEYDEEGNKGELLDVTGGDSLVLEIPQDYKGTQISVIPVGIYEKKGMTFRAFYYDENGDEKTVPGTWFVDGTAYFENEVEIDAGKHTVKYEYDGDTYYYAGGEPVPFSSDQPGIVEFKNSDSETAYSVILHPYLRAAFSYDKGAEKGIKSVLVNHKAQPAKELSKLKAGDHITVETEDNYRIFCTEFKLDDPERIEGGYRYTISVPETDKREISLIAAKSDLKVVLDKSVGVDTLFDITASGINEKNCHHSADEKAKLTIYDGSIGVEEKVSIAAKEGQLEPGHALKVEIRKTDGNGKETEEVKYIGVLPGTVDIGLYDEKQEIVNLDKIYRSVQVEISLEEAWIYNEKKIENGKIFVKVTEGLNAGELKEGDIAEPSQKVEVSIIPEKGYYVSGKKAENDQYTDTMKFSKYLSDIDKIAEAHKIKKFYQVTLDTAAEHGTCVYKLNGEEISKTTTLNVREEDKLELEYELTDPDYEIKWEDFFHTLISSKKKTVPIQISSEIDGSIIKAEDKAVIERKEK